MNKKILCLLLAVFCCTGVVCSCNTNSDGQSVFYTSDMQSETSGKGDSSVDSMLDSTKEETIKSKEHIKVACVGDSLTWGQKAEGGQISSPYPKVLQDLLGSDYLVRNFGARGRVICDGYSDSTFSDRSYSATKEYQASLTFGADIVIFCLGTNDSWKCDLQSERGRQNFRDSLRRMVDAYTAAGAQEIYVCLPPYTTHANCQTKLEKLVLPLLRSMIAENGWKSIDFFSVTENHAEYLGSDGLHLTKAGYAVMAQTVYDTLS